MPIVASYRKLVAVAKNRRQSTESFHYRLLECRFWWRNASQRINFGRPHLGWEYRMFSAYWLSISEINLPKTVERTSENKNVLLVKDAAIVLTVSARFSATCCCKFVSENLFSKPDFLKKKLPKCIEMQRNGTKWVTFSNLWLLFYERSYVTLVGTLIDLSITLWNEWVND